MKIIQLIFCLFMTCLIGCGNQAIHVDGRLEDVSPQETWILYRTAHEWGADEYHRATLRAINIQTKEVVIIDSLFMEHPSTSFFANDSLVAIPGNGCLELYNLHKKEYEKTPLLTFNKDYAILNFSFNQDRTKVAVLLRDFNSSIYDIQKNEAYDRVELNIVDFKNKKEYIIDHHTYESGLSALDMGDILWHGDQVVYSFQNQLYYYQLGNTKRICLTNGIGSYAIDGDQLIFATDPKDAQYALKCFSFDDLSITDLKIDAEDESFLLLLTIDTINKLKFYTTYIHNTRRAILDNSLFYYYGKGEGDKFEEQDQLILYKSKKLSVEQEFERIKVGEKAYDDKAVLIIKKTS